MIDLAVLITENIRFFCVASACQINFRSEISMPECEEDVQEFMTIAQIIKRILSFHLGCCLKGLMIAVRLICLPEQWLCHDNTSCIHESFQCDGVPHCPDWSDEVSCTTGIDYFISKVILCRSISIVHHGPVLF